MTTLSAEEKSTLVLVYTQNTLVRGEVITKQAIRVSTWLRTQGVPDYMHLFKASVFYFGSVLKVMNYKETYVPVTSVIGFHVAPPLTEPLDYDNNEDNRVMVPATGLVGAFLFKGFLRISSRADLSTSIELAHSAWMSIYDVDISSSSMPQMPTMHLPMVLVSPKQVCYAIE